MGFELGTWSLLTGERQGWSERKPYHSRVAAWIAKDRTSSAGLGWPFRVAAAFENRTSVTLPGLVTGHRLPLGMACDLGKTGPFRGGQFSIPR